MEKPKPRTRYMAAQAFKPQPKEEADEFDKLPEKYCPVCNCMWPWRFIGTENGRLREFYRCLGCGTEIHKHRWDKIPKTFMDTTEAKLRAEIARMRGIACP
jgi:DNA-directed RNA polymerase subunit RPC12/RpoP